MYCDLLNTALTQIAPLLMAVIIINHTCALNPTAQPLSIVNKTRVGMGLQVLHQLVVFCIYCKNTWSCTEGPTSNPNTREAEGDRMTFPFDLFKDQVKVCLSFDSQINDYAIPVYTHMSSFKKTTPIPNC